MSIKLTTSIPKEQWGVHKTHCCKNHGCKYGDDDCPVVLNLIFQKYSCEFGSQEDPCHGVKYYFRELLNCLSIYTNIIYYRDCIFFFKENELYFVYNTTTNMIYPIKKVFDILIEYDYSFEGDRNGFIMDEMKLKFSDIIKTKPQKLSVGTISEESIKTIERIILRSLTKNK